MKFILCAIVVLSLSCNESKTQNLCSINILSPEGKSNQQMITRTGINRTVLIETDSNGDGKINDYVWVNADSNLKENFQLLFNEIQSRENIPIEQIWYGPKNHKLIGKSDLNKDGILESIVFYNNMAAPKVVQGIVARIEVDTNLDGKTDLWLYPNLRVELDSNFLGTPNFYSENSEVISGIYNSFVDNKKWEKQLQPLEKSKSYALHPELIPRDVNRAVIPRNY